MNREDLLRYRKLLMQENFIFYASEMLRKFDAGEHHERWADLVNSYKRLCVIAARDHGKCKVGSSRVLLADGSYPQLAELVNTSVRVVAYDETRGAWTTAMARVDDFTAPKDLVALRTSSGRIAHVTPEHLYLTPTGWRPASDLAVGDRVSMLYAAPRALSSVRPNLNFGRLGALLGGRPSVGGFAADRTVRAIPHEVFLAADEDIAAFVVAYLTNRTYHPEDPDVLNGISMLLLRLGVPSFIYSRRVYPFVWTELVRLGVPAHVAERERARPDVAPKLAPSGAGLRWDTITRIWSHREGVVPIHVEEHHNYVSDGFLDHNSYAFTFAYPLWMAEKHPGRTGYIFSASQPQADEILLRIQREVDQNPKLQHLRGGAGARWSAKTMEFKNGFILHARGFGTKVRGGHPVMIVNDDILNDESAYSDTIRRKEIDYFYNAVTNMIEPDGQIVVIGCVARGTWVATAEGYRRIEALEPVGATADPRDPRILDANISIRRPAGTNTGRLATATKFFKNGRCATKYIRTHYGFELTSSLPHPVRVLRPDGGEVWTHEPEVGDFVALDVGADLWAPEPTEPRAPTGAFDAHIPEDAYVAGAVWGSQCNRDVGTPHMRGVLGCVPIAAEFVKPEYARYVVPSPVSRPGARVARGRIEINPELFKTITPSVVLQGPKSCALAFLSGFFETCRVKHRHARAELPPAEAEALQLIAANLGGIMRRGTSARYGGGVGPGAVDFDTALELVQVAPPRFRELVRVLKPRTKSTNEWLKSPDVYPDVFPFPELVGLQPPGVGSPFPRLAEVRKQAELRRLRPGEGSNYASDVYKLMASGRRWDRIEEVAPGPDVETFDFVIPDGNAFVSNGVVSHNTPYHAQDLYGDLKQNTQYKVAEFPAIDAAGVPLWPARYNLAKLEERRNEIKSLRFSREFLCVPVSDLSSLFGLGMFQGDPIEQMTVTCGHDGAWWRARGIQSIYIGVDFALSTSTGADFTVIFVIGLDASGNIWVIDILRDRGLSFGDQLSAINSAGQRFRPDLIYVESNQAQRIFGNELIERTNLPIKHFVTTSEKHSLETGIPALRIPIENKKLRIPRGDAASVEKTDVWIDEMRSFTFAKGKVFSVGAHDDTAMAYYIACQAALSNPFSFSFGEQPGDAAALEEQLADVDDMFAAPPRAEARHKRTNLDDPFGFDEEDAASEDALSVTAAPRSAQAPSPVARPAADPGIGLLDFLKRWR